MQLTLVFHQIEGIFKLLLADEADGVVLLHVGFVIPHGIVHLTKLTDVRFSLDVTPLLDLLCSSSVPGFREVVNSATGHERRVPDRSTK